MQTIKNKIHFSGKKFALIFAVGIALFVLAAPGLSFAKVVPCHPEQNTKPDPVGTALSASELNSCESCNKSKPTSAELNNCLKNNGIVKDINTIVRFLSAGAGIIIVGSIVVGGIQYAIAGNNPNQVSAAKKRIVDSLIALVAFFFIFAFLNWLIPGGLLFS